MDIVTFETYCEKPYALTVEQMREMHNELIEEIGTDPDAVEIYEELLETAVEYAAIRNSWNVLFSREERNEKDARRTSLHNSVIINFNMLSRYLRMQGKKAEWRDKLGYEENDRLYRKTIGDFACYLAFINGLCAR